MKEILDIADEMTLSVKESRFYKDYILCKEKIMEDNELFEKMREFKKLHVQLQCKKINDDFYDFNEEVNVSRMYYNLLQNRLAKDFFESEEKLFELMGEIYSKLGKQYRDLLIEF